MSNFYKRGFHNDTTGKHLLSALSEGGELYDLLKIIQADKDLVIQIRDNYFNVYYRGGNVAKVVSEKSVDVDQNYFHRAKEDDKSFLIEQKNNAKQLFIKGEFQKYIDLVTKAMLHYDSIVGKDTAEKECQHQLCISNEYGKSDYTIIDLEYEVSKKSLFHYRGKRTTPGKNIPSPRFDIIAIRNSDHRLCIMELKKGTNALDGKAGLQEHAESFHNTVGFNDETKQAFIEEMQGIVKLKQQLGILDPVVKIDEKAEIEYLFVYQFSNTDKYFKTFKEQHDKFLNVQKKPYHNYLDAKEKKVIWLKKEDEFALKD